MYDNNIVMLPEGGKIMSHILETTIAGRKLKVEYGKTGMLSNCAIFISYGDTVVMVNANASESPRAGIDFFPLQDFQEASPRKFPD